MKRSRRAFILTIVLVVAVLVVGTVTTTYAWFLSRYSHDYPFELDSTSPLIIKYETDLQFASGSPTTMIPAKAKTTVGISQQALDPIDVFDETKVQTSAQAVKLTASGAYWAGEDATAGQFKIDLYAYTASFMGSSALSARLTALSTQEKTYSSLTEGNLQEVLNAENITYENAPTERLITRNDLVYQGEIDYAVVFSYLNNTFLYYGGNYYLSSPTNGSGYFTLPAAMETDNNLRYWAPLTAPGRVTVSGNTTADVYDGVNFLLQPNTTFSFTLYAFVAKTDEELDPAMNGETLSLFVSLTVAKPQQSEEQGGNE